jgi:anti-sigma regulatory factor (Ser/Thr protein kinase)
MPYHRCPACGLTGYTAPAWSAARTCANCAAPLPDSSRLELVPRARHSVSRTLPAHPHAGAQARHTVAALDVPQAMRDALAIVASELVNNAVLHAGLRADDTVELRIDIVADSVRLAVGDSGPGFVPEELDGERDFLVPGGNGLVLVESLATAWGVDRADGCTVWCELTFEDVAVDATPSVRRAPVAARQALVAAPA